MSISKYTDSITFRTRECLPNIDQVGVYISVWLCQNGSTFRVFHFRLLYLRFCLNKALLPLRKV